MKQGLEKRTFRARAGAAVFAPEPARPRLHTGRRYSVQVGCTYPSDYTPSASRGPPGPAGV